MVPGLGISPSHIEIKFPPDPAEVENMSWTTALVVFAVLIAAYWLKRAGQISRKEAQSHLSKGALLIDVRSPSEFRSRHLPNAINLPLDQIETMLPQRVGDKKQLLLLHCQSGMRSGAARKKLKDMGYLRAFNLGSYARAAQVVDGK
jgi:phage shock protein E